jgi:hypothetical protein
MGKSAGKETWEYAVVMLQDAGYWLPANKTPGTQKLNYT